MIEKIKEMERDAKFELLLEMVTEVHGQTGDLEDYVVFDNDEGFFEMFYSGNVMEAVRAISYGDYNYNDSYVLIDVYGNLQTYNDYEYMEYLNTNFEEIIGVYVDTYDTETLSELYENHN